jgi:hypothetical protein
MATSAARSPRFNERRNFRRRRLSVPVEFWGADTALRGEAVDISEGGLLINTRETFWAGTPLFLRLQLPCPQASYPLETNAVVVWSKPGHCMGLKFRGLDDDSCEIIRKFLALPEDM